MDSDPYATGAVLRGKLRLGGARKPMQPAQAQTESRAPTNRTLSELAFEEHRRLRLANSLKKQPPKTHKDKIKEFNEKLDALSEHYDIPKVGPG